MPAGTRHLLVALVGEGVLLLPSLSGCTGGENWMPEGVRLAMEGDEGFPAGCDLLRVSRAAFPGRQHPSLALGSLAARS